MEGCQGGCVHVARRVRASARVCGRGGSGGRARRFCPQRRAPPLAAPAPLRGVGVDRVERAKEGAPPAALSPHTNKSSSQATGERPTQPRQWETIRTTERGAMRGRKTRPTHATPCCRNAPPFGPACARRRAHSPSFVLGRGCGLTGPVGVACSWRRSAGLTGRADGANAKPHNTHAPPSSCARARVVC